MSPKPWFVVITGASSGFGRAMARGLLTRAGLAPAGSTFLLVARSTEQLAQTKTLMEESGIEANVSLLSADLSDLGAISQKVVPRMAEMLAAAGDVFGRVMLVNNAGSLGNISDRIDKAGACPDTLQSYFNLNLTGVITLTCGALLSAEASADKLLVLLRDSKFESGSHHDYYDLPEPTF
ncbi:hypothetical protein H696_00569 [Fonticula alba]|uniref:Uncharacterized protein n=1 Tax=Fonticula alba TaxID=691883 RepID=A0A058ZF93_FONAL|nr:hypothetical protein H696_00569 [Fonticula alba]KCV73019.1 hypothetical protein H696_00569 [Fonticula alba]|eukprot:XP_009492720.1 hypothetical protein H696_00569 [Fonticula alba]